MKRLFSFFIALSAVLTIAGCGKSDSSKKASKNSPDTSASDFTSDVQTTKQPDPLDPAGKTTASAPEKTEKTTAAASSGAADNSQNTDRQEETTLQPDPIENNSFSYDDNGAVIFDENSDDKDEEILIAAAQALFESACTTQWNFTVGCPYETDPDDYIETDFDWRFYRIVDSDITSFSDVENDYYKVFSRRYPNNLSEIFIDGGGSVYALNSARGADIFYTGSKITEIQSNSGDEIFFTVENHYSGTDVDGSASYTTTDTFSIVIESDGSWHAGQFRLPY